MNLGMLFRKENESLHLDMDKLLEITDEKFIEHAKAWISVDSPIDEMKFPSKDYVYFRIEKVWHSMAYDRREKALLLSRQDWKKKWRFIVGYKKQ